jgi:hypothetical protein
MAGCGDERHLAHCLGVVLERGREHLDVASFRSSQREKYIRYREQPGVAGGRGVTSARGGDGASQLGERIRAGIRGSRLVTVPTGHTSPVERPDLVTAAIEEHLAAR